MKTRKFSVFSAFLLLAALSAAQAATWRVDAAQADAGAFASLQEALDRAADGDTVLVADGDYEPIALAASRAVAIRSENGPETTFITGDGSGRCATFTDEDGEPIPLATLEGFTLRGGADSSEAGGGGAFGGRLVRCILRENTAFRGGGASCAILENCLLTANAADLAGGGAVSSELVNCTVAGNRAGGTGGGTAGCDLSNSIVQANESPDGADAVAGFAAYSCTTPLLPGEGNTAAGARFADPANGDWSLAAGSPCLDAGKAGFGTASRDLAGNARAAGEGLDLGAYERPGSSGASARNANTVTIAFDPNGGTITRDQMTFRVGERYSGFPVPVRPGYMRLGWFTAPSGGTRINSRTVASASHSKFYAQWARAVTVAFDPNGGTCPVREMTFRVGSNYAGFPKPVRPDHVCTGWFTAPSGGTRINGKTVASASHKVFYAHWARVVTIAFDANGGTCSPAKKVLRVGTTYAGQVPRPTRPGYLFLGWYTSTAADAKRLKGATVVRATHTKFYAHWARAVTVEFNPNGGTCSVAKKRYQVGKAYGSLPVPVRPGCIFLGWRASGGVDVTASTKATLSCRKLTARWQKVLSVHPVGDSMTYGIRTRTNPLNPRGNPPSVVAKISNQGWRGYLNQALSPWAGNRGSGLVFRGTHEESGYAGNVPHDGYPGETATDYARKHKSAVEVEADIQIVFLGMNDAIHISLKGGNYGGYFSSTRDGLARVLSSVGAGTTAPLTIVVTEPKVTTLIVEHNPAYSVSAINTVIGSYINPYVRSRAGGKVKVLDIENLYSDRSYTDDGFHLSVSGNQAVASRLDGLIESSWP